MSSGRAPSRLRQALAMRLRAAFQDLFGDAPGGSTTTSSTGDEEVLALLAQAEAQLAALREAWAASVARARQADREWQAACRSMERQDAAVDEALLAGRDTLARATQRELNMWQSRVGVLAERRRVETGLVEQFAQAVQALELQITTARRQLDDLAAGDHATAAHEQLEALSQTLARLADGRPERKGRAL